MTDTLAVRNPERCPSHPGAVLSDILTDMDIGKGVLAEMLGISRQQLYDILNERKPVSPAIAARFGKFFGDGAAIWLRMQASYDAWHAERETDLSNVRVLKTA